MTSPEVALLGAVLLAGGASRRFGADNKLLAEVGGKPMLANAAGALLASGVRDVVVVTGAEHQAYTAALAGLPVRFVHNSDWDAGMGGSVAAGVRALASDLAGAFIVPGDMVNLTPDLLRRLSDSFYRMDCLRVVVPVTDAGGQRNPVLWPRGRFSDLASLSGPHGGKTMLDGLGPDERIDVGFEDGSLFVDIDTREDYARVIGDRNVDFS